jgi:hypothetical protein
MKVSRQSDGADLELYSDPNPCGCYYAAQVSGNASGCVACSPLQPCATGQCYYGYCEGTP